MLHKMRREDRQLSCDACIKVIAENNMGILSLNSTEEYPYGVPLNYMYHEGAVYFHCAKEGRKLELISQNPKVCFAIVGKNEIIPGEFANNYKSVMIFGSIEIISGDKLKYKLLAQLGESFGCEPAMLDRYIMKYIDACHVLKLDIHHISGKAR